MYGIFMECWVSLKLFGGNGAILLLFLASAIYLIVAEESAKKKIMLGIVPLIILIGFLFPVTKIVYVAAFDDGSDTYYRLTANNFIVNENMMKDVSWESSAKKYLALSDELK